jgi:hypothetical protein
MRYDGPRSFEAQQKYLVETFLNFRQRWSERAAQEGKELDLCTDGSFDIECLNRLIFQHTTHPPLPYNAERSYGRVWDVDSELHGFFLGQAESGQPVPAWNLQAELWSRYNLPCLELQHDHMPHHDAYTIAASHQALLGIKQGLWPKK